MKFQLFRIDKLFAPEIVKKNKDIQKRKKWELPLEFIPRLAEHCKKHKIKFSCTPFYIEAVKELKPFGGLHLTGLTPPRTVRRLAVDAPGLPVNAWRRRWYLPGPPTGDDVAVSHRVVTDREFEYPIEHHPATPRAATVETKYKLVQVAEKMRVINRALMGSKQPPLGQRGNAVHCGQQIVRVLFACGPSGALAARFVTIAELVQTPVPLPAVRDDRRARFDVIRDEGMERGRRCVRQRCHSAPAVPLRFLDLHRDTGQYLLALRTAAGQSCLVATDVGFINLNDPGKPFTSGAHQHRSQPMQHRPHRLVGADLQRPLQAQRRNAVLSAGEEPASVEPDRQWSTGPVEDRTGGHRSTAAVPGTLEPGVAQSPALAVAACGAHEAGRPAQPFQIVRAVGVGPEPCLEFADRSRVVLARARVVHRLILHH